MNVLLSLLENKIVKVRKGALLISYYVVRMQSLLISYYVVRMQSYPILFLEVTTKKVKYVHGIPTKCCGQSLRSALRS